MRTNSRSLLVRGAHPDDETLFAGTMAKYLAEGGWVGILCGTRGERGSTGGLCSIDDLPRVRETELRTPMNAIGVDEGDVHFLSYEDRKLAQAPLEEYAARDGQAHSPASSAGGEFRPAGDERHPDHVAMSRLKSDAIAAADSRWYPEAVHGYPELTMNGSFSAGVGSAPGRHSQWRLVRGIGVSHLRHCFYSSRPIYRRFHER